MDRHTFEPHPISGAAPAAPALRTVHLVGRLTHAVFRALGPTTDALRHAGHVQVLVLMEDPSHPALADMFHPDLEVVTLPGTGGPLVRWHRWSRAVRHVMGSGPADTVHFHGFLPSVLAAPLLGTQPAARLLVSPHGSRLQQPRTWLQRVAGVLVRPWLRSLAASAVVSMPLEARVMARACGQPAALVPVPVSSTYFVAGRRPARHPLVAGGVVDEPEAMAARFAQLAVLLGAGDGGLAFNWVGAVNGRAREQLQAADIGIFENADPHARAERLGTAWLFLCPHGGRGFPGPLTEAMACGLPVVAMDTANHRDIIVDGETGYLCDDDETMVRQVMRLLGDKALRDRMGAAASQSALRRFGGAGFESALLDAYRGTSRSPA